MERIFASTAMWLVNSPAARPLLYLSAGILAASSAWVAGQAVEKAETVNPITSMALAAGMMGTAFAMAARRGPFRIVGMEDDAAAGPDEDPLRISDDEQGRMRALQETQPPIISPRDRTPEERAQREAEQNAGRQKPGFFSQRGFDL